MAPFKGRKKYPDPPEAGIKRSFGWVAVLGAVLVVCGLVGLFYVGFATITSMVLFGWLLLIGGVVGLAQAVQNREINYFWLALVVAALYIAAGVVVIRNPAESAAALTMFAALLFLTGGIFRLFGGLVVRGPQMVWTLIQGAVGILLAVLVLANWPHSSVYVIGAFFSLALLFDGLGLLGAGLGGRRIVGMVAEARQTPVEH
ncbi:HdeD family acid-resistance protein [Streptomyces sp. NPDC058691]|uniref:HdeD family acid-resistance protein n=1 Tax=Streptomyces sp. NPDC058691 TaxID=3346601 RepID=UPI003657E82C